MIIINYLADNGKVRTYKFLSKAAADCFSLMYKKQIAKAKEILNEKR